MSTGRNLHDLSSPKIHFILVINFREVESGVPCGSVGSFFSLYTMLNFWTHWSPWPEDYNMWESFLELWYCLSVKERLTFLLICDLFLTPSCPYILHNGHSYRQRDKPSVVVSVQTFHKGLDSKLYLHYSVVLFPLRWYYWNVSWVFEFRTPFRIRPLYIVLGYFSLTEE